VSAAAQRVRVPVTAAAPHAVVLHHPSTPTANAFFDHSPSVSWSSSLSISHVWYSYLPVLEIYSVC